MDQRYENSLANDPFVVEPDSAAPGEAFFGKQDLFRPLVEQSLDGIMLVDAQGAIVEWNASMESITGLTKSETVGGQFWAVQFQMAPPEARTNGLSEQLRKALGDIAYEKGSEENRALLFYFAGHGDTLDLADGTQLGYIVPSDCPLKNIDPMGFDRKAISMKDVEVLALKVKSKHFIMLFDSCFSGSLFSVVRAAPVDISEKSALPEKAIGMPISDKVCFNSNLESKENFGMFPHMIP